MKKFVSIIAVLFILSLVACSNQDTPPTTDNSSNTQSENITMLDEGVWPMNEYTEGLPVPSGTVAWAMLDTEHENFSISIAGIDENDYDNYMELLIQEGFSVVENVSEKIKGENYVSVGTLLSNGEKGLRLIIEKPNKYNTIKGTPYAHPTIMMRKEAYDALGGYTVLPRTRRGQDLDLWYRFYAKGFEGYNIQEPLLKYHESVGDYKKRDLKTAIGIMKTMYLGYKNLGFPVKTYIYIFKPIVASIIPNKLMYMYHKRLTNKDKANLINAQN